MKNILCYGDSNTWGYDAETAQRFPPEVRWTGRLQALLGPDCRVLECGLNGRTTAYDDGFDGWSCGSRYLPVALKTHDPLDLVVLMLGTNDLKDRLGLAPDEVARGMEKLVQTVRSPGLWGMRSAPEVLVVAPMLLNGEALATTSPFGESFTPRSVERSRRLGEVYGALCRRLNCPFADAGALGPVGSRDGVHMAPPDHRRLAELLAPVISGLL